MMTQEARFGYAEFPDLQVLELPYGRGDLSMAVLLPKQVDGLRLLEEKLNRENLATWLDGLRQTSVRVFLPRFRITSDFSLGETLKAMGMVDAFGPGADFSGMDGTHQLSISAVLHKAFVEVNEEGTEAAAVTAIPFVGALPKPPPIFRADHPFVFLIQDKQSGTILFIGRATDPSA
jgi:serpin B